MARMLEDGDGAAHMIKADELAARAESAARARNASTGHVFAQVPRCASARRRQDGRSPAPHVPAGAEMSFGIAFCGKLVRSNEAERRRPGRGHGDAECFSDKLDVMKSGARIAITGIALQLQ